MLRRALSSNKISLNIQQNTEKQINLNDKVPEINTTNNFITQQKLGGCMIQKAQDKILIQLDIQTPK